MENEESEVDRPATSRSFFFDTNISMRRYILRMAALSVVPSISIAMLIGLLGILNEQTAPEFDDVPMEAVIPAIVIITPLVETLLMSLLFWFLSWFTQQRLLLALSSCVIWAILHSLQAAAWGLVIAWPFFIFSCAYLAWREKSWWQAIWVTWCIHMLQNLLPGLAIMFAGEAS